MLTISGKISQTGSSGLTLNGLGELVLSGSNSYSGSTTIAGGTLQIGSGGSGASIATTSGVLNNGSLVFNHTDAVTLPSVISGSGSLTQAGMGLLVLLGSNSFTGPTTVGGGTLQVGNGGSGASIGGSSGVLDNGSLVFNHSDAQVLAASISGPGNVTQMGGSLTLLGNNSYSGTTTISSGTLQIGAGGSGASLGGTSGIVNNGALVFNHSDALSLALPVSGSGSLTQAGGGTLTLTGVNTYSGKTFVAGGTLALAGARALAIELQRHGRRFVRQQQ